MLVSEALLKRKTLTGDQVGDVINRHRKRMIQRAVARMG
jgi:hypothetical protein